MKTFHLPLLALIVFSANNVFAESNKAKEKSQWELEELELRKQRFEHEQYHKDKETFVCAFNEKHYHYPWCKYVRDLRKLRYFKSAEKAREANKIPCGNCRPPRETEIIYEQEYLEPTKKNVLPGGYSGEGYPGGWTGDKRPGTW